MTAAPLDAKFGRELARQLEIAVANRIKHVAFTYDPYTDFDELPTQATLWITPTNLTRTREARGRFSRSFEYALSLIVGQEPNYNPQWLDAWLLSFDDVLDDVEELEVFGNRVVLIEQSERFDPSMLREYARLVVVAQLTFNVVQGVS